MLKEPESGRSIIALEGSAVLDYGPETSTRLEIAGVDASGNRHVMTFDHEALGQLAKLLRQIEAKVPGAVKGH